ncbi:MAG: hypothetical protein ACI9E9_001893, partial [Reinekea sp.]
NHDHGALVKIIRNEFWHKQTPFELRHFKPINKGFGGFYTA